MKTLTIDKSYTDRTDPSVVSYLRDISGSAYNPLSVAEEEALFTRLRSGDTAARERIILANLRFVVSVAKQYGGYLPLPDLISAGNEGLCHAVDRFDVARGFKFITYAVWYIRQRIIAATQKAGCVNLPQRLRLAASRAAGMANAHFVRTGEQVHPCDVDEQLSALSAGYSLTSLSANVAGGDTNFTLEEALATDEPAPVVNSEALIRAMYAAVPSRRAADIVVGSFGIGGAAVPLEALAERYGLSRERIRQILHGTLCRLRKKVSCEPVLRELLLSC